MLIWLQNHIFTILIIAVLAAFFGWLVYTLIRDKRKGKTSCCGGCAGCAMAGQCHAHLTGAEAETPADGKDAPESKKE